MTQWCDTHRITYYADDGECPICSSSTVDDVEAADGRGAEA